ncbi:hypothetical protein Ddye_009198 [Dipteronia dyeriana]|uniref:RRM domain-containing protein n=1 Tax=Dipteronia dyeriana TaxID=168575 RepID=A0AAD9XAW4_9ROSI|nr:hypothetical protein Ddye_009198 [Dipteronia dyeriana]
MVRPFGKVRDIFLSDAKSSRRSRFAFVRFGTEEEASKVARSTNGMHVYGWPITTKMASKDWKMRSFKQVKQGVRTNQEQRSQ